MDWAHSSPSCWTRGSLTFSYFHLWVCIHLMLSDNVNYYQFCKGDWYITTELKKKKSTDIFLSLDVFYVFYLELVLNEKGVHGLCSTVLWLENGIALKWDRIGLWDLYVGTGMALTAGRNQVAVWWGTYILENWLQKNTLFLHKAVMDTLLGALTL